MAGRVSVIGAPQLQRQLKALVDSVAVSAAAKAVNHEAAEAARDIISAQAPSGGVSEQKGWTPLKDSVDVHQRGMPAFVRQNRGKNPAGLWLEHGTAERSHTSGKSTGRVPATNWFSVGRNKSRAKVRRILRKGYQRIVEGVGGAG